MKVLEKDKIQVNDKTVVLLSSLNTTGNGCNPARGEYRSHAEFLPLNHKNSPKNKRKI
jgi:hypothetical protein